MARSKVYFTDFHTIAFGDGLPTKLKKLIKKAGISELDCPIRPIGYIKVLI